MRGRDGLHDRQAQAAADAGAAVVAATEEAVERSGRVLLGHARAGVRDLDQGTLASLGQAQRDRGALRGVLAYVAEQVGQHLAQPRLVRDHPEMLRRLGADRPAGLDGAGIGGGVPDQLGQVGLRQVQR
jgi:hypothetical protein